MLQSIRDGFGRSVIIIILGLIAVSFIFWGVDFNLTGPSYAAVVNGEEIPLEEFERNFQAEQSNFLDLYGVELDEDIRRQLRSSTLDRLIRQRALSQQVAERGYRVSDERLTRSIQAIPAFQIGNQFSFEMLQTQLAFQGISVAAFEEMQRQQLELLDLQNGIVNSSFVTPDEYRRYVELANQRREIGYARFDVQSFLDGVQVTDEEVAAHYDEFRDRYMTEESAALEYVELRRSEIAEQIDVSEQEIRDYYERRRLEFTADAERAASHILITAEPGESDDAARARAEALVERIRSGEDFAALAAEHSDDPGTASSGGSLGWIGRGMLAGPFEDTLYAMESVGDVSDPVRTDFGWHIIRYDELRAGEERSFEEVEESLTAEYRIERADDLYFNQANRLTDLAFEEYDSLERVAAAMELPLKEVESFPRSGDPTVFPNSAAVVDVVFGFQPLETGINSDLIELSEEHVAVVRVVERFPPEQRPLDQVADEIRETLRHERAAELAADAAGAFTAALPEPLTPQFLGGSALDAAPAAAADAASGDAAEAPSDAEGGVTDAAADDSAAVAESTDAAAVESGVADATVAEEALVAESGVADAAAEADGGAGADDGAGAIAGADAAETDATMAAAYSPAARLAAEHGGTWHAPRWVQRSDITVPVEVLSQAFNLGVPAEGTRLHRSVELSNGSQALLVLSRVQPGDPAEVTLDRRTALRDQLFEAMAGAELGAYAMSVREQAEVNVPPQVLDPQF